MSSYHGKMLPPITEPAMLEKLAAALWEARFPDRQSMLNGRQGQAQKGLDVLMTTRAGRTVGIQCKAVSKVTKAMLGKEVAKALTHEPKIHQFILFTSAKNDAELVNEAHRLTELHEEQGLFSVTIYGWGDVMRLLEGHPSIVATFFPELAARSEPAAERITLTIGGDLEIGMDDTELALFCSETAVKLKTPRGARLQVIYEAEQRLLQDIQSISAHEHPTIAQRQQRSNLEAGLEAVAKKTRRMEAAVALLLVEDEIRSPWLIGPDWPATAQVLRRLVFEVFQPAKSSAPGLLNLKIRSPRRAEIVTWIALSAAEEAEFISRCPSYRPGYYLGSVFDLGSKIAAAHVLPAAIAKIAQFSDSFDVGLDTLRRDGNLAVSEWQVEAA